MIRPAAVVVAAALLAGTVSAFSQTPMPESENGRFTFSQSGGDLLRLDGRTGQVSLCSKREVGWSCLTVPDERSALETEISRVQRENVILKRELMARGIPLPGNMQEPQAHPSKREELGIRIPSDADLERVTAFIEKVWRRLVDMVQTMQKEQDAEKKG